MPFQAPGVYVIEEPSAVKPIAGVSTSTAGFIGVMPDGVTIPAPIKGSPGKFASVSPAPKVSLQVPQLITSWSEFVTEFGDIVGGEQVQQTTAATNPVTINSEYRSFVHAVNGFFLNGGSRCYVIRVAQASDINESMLNEKFGPIDEIAIVAAPGLTDGVEALRLHCEGAGDRFAILDGPKDQEPDALSVTTRSDYTALYYPWLKVSDGANRLMNPNPTNRDDWLVEVPPSGHMAGIYARVDAQRGVHKAPANEVVRGVARLKYPISRAHQEGLNPIGINCIRDLNGNIRVWGARTLGDPSGEWKYVSVRRLFLFLRESIDEGMQWVVFEPNTPDLWAKITRNITAFLTTVWRSGALFGATPQEAFYVKCDAESNPREERDLGRVWTEIGVAVAVPAEFVIFRISQWAGPGG